MAKTGSVQIWIVGYEDGKFWCSNRSPLRPPLSSADTYDNAMRSANNEAALLMMKHPIKRDMSKARVVRPLGMLGMGVISAPEYIDYNIVRKTPEQVWVIEAPTRYQALKIAKQYADSRLIDSSTVAACNSKG